MSVAVSMIRKQDICRFDDCNKNVVAKELCMGHYSQQRSGKELSPLRNYELGNQSIRDMTESEITWMAGWLEAEGWFGTSHSSSVRIEVTSVDFDVLEKAKEITGGCGSICKKNSGHENRQPIKVWTVAGKRAVILMERVLPYMGKRRSQRIKELLYGKP